QQGFQYLRVPVGILFFQLSS
uniref:Predicted gene 10945 n=1 Tax=Mus spicilegus TaxID=10103 RepID=A0A8C6N265_MUSSI